MLSLTLGLALTLGWVDGKLEGEEEVDGPGEVDGEEDNKDDGELDVDGAEEDFVVGELLRLG